MKFTETETDALRMRLDPADRESSHILRDGQLDRRQLRFIHQVEPRDILFRCRRQHRLLHSLGQPHIGALGSMQALESFHCNFDLLARPIEANGLTKMRLHRRGLGDRKRPLRAL